MGKKQILKSNKDPKEKSIINGKYYPLVSVCTPTFNRRPFISTMLECFRNQTYPKHRMEWIIVDDGTDKIKDLLDSANIPQIRYFSVDQKMALGEKRNFMHKQVKGSIIVYMDDDDYYPPERVSHSVDMLMSNKEALCAGSSEIYIYFKHIHQMYQCGPYGPNHATAGTFAFKYELIKQSEYENNAALAEERHFLKNYTVPFVQLDPMKTILVFSHNHNTFDKRKLLENPHPDVMKVSSKTVDDFICNPEEKKIKDFFLTEIDGLLEKYDPGHPKWKPDVLIQMKKIEEEREKMIQQMSVGGQQIMMQNDKGEQVPLSPQQVIQVLNDLQNQIKFLTDKLNESQQIIMEKDTLIRNLQRDVMSSGAINTPNATGELLKKEESISELHIEKIRLELDAEEDAKCEPVIMINIAD
jgi:hypothetical protein